MKAKKIHVIVVIIIVLTAAFLRLYDLDRADVLTDEASISFRSIGYVDFLATPYQTTPIEWLNARPLWTYLSFHDHPPLNFLIQHIFFRLFGVSVMVMRLVPALSGIISVWLLYVISRRFANDTVAVAAAGVLAVNDYHIWISRLALQESITILAMLLTFYVFLRSIEHKNFFYIFGIVAGLALLVKLNVIFVFGICFLYAIRFKSTVFKQKELYIAGAIALVIFSPYLIYNFFLYRTFGHLDFQLSYLFNQFVDAWQIRPGRLEFPTKSIALKYFFINLRDGLSPAFLIAVASAIFASIWIFLKKDHMNEILFLWLILLTFFIFLILVGPSRRFLTMLVPWFSLFIAYVFFCIPISKKILKTVFIVLIAVFLVYEIFFSFNTTISYAKPSHEGFFYSRIKQVAYPYGYNELEPYVTALLNGKKPGIVLPIHNKNIAELVDRRVESNAGQAENLMLVYDPRMYGEAILWFLTRHLIYGGWPIISYDIYTQAIEENGEEYFDTLGIEHYYYVAPADNIILSNESIIQATESELHEFEESLKKIADRIDTITNRDGKILFHIYKY